MVTLSRKLALIPALFLLLLGIPVIKWGIADIKAYPARYAIAEWEKDSRFPSQEELDKAIKAINTAISWQPNNPEVSDLKGRLNHYKALISENQLVRNSALQEALKSYKHSIAQRPQWPYSWANLALIKAQLGEFDNDYKQAIRQSATNGPWENAVNIAITEAGLIGWRTLSSEEQLLIIENIQRGMRRNLNHIKVIINRYNSRSLICAYLPKDRYRRKLCGF